MALQAAAAIAAIVGVGTDVGFNIASVLQSSSGGGGDQSSLVQGYCNLCWNQLKNYDRLYLTVVIYKSNLDVNLNYQQGGYIGFVQLGNAGYDIYFVANGYIKNNGERGFENWCVQGNQTQDDNIITFN
jgi:hypothetical protein